MKLIQAKRTSLPSRAKRLLVNLLDQFNSNYKVSSQLDSITVNSLGNQVYVFEYTAKAGTDYSRFVSKSLLEAQRTVSKREPKAAGFICTYTIGEVETIDDPSEEPYIDLKVTIAVQKA